MDELGFWPVLLIAIGLSADCFAVALSGSISIKNPTPLHGLRVALAFSLAQALMPLLGWLAGSAILDYIAPYDHWLAFGLLAFVAGRMLWESFHSKEKERPTDFTRGLVLLVLAVATSIDALAVGLSFAFLKVNIGLASLTIGLLCFVITLAGFVVGRKASSVIGQRAEVVGALILIAIGLRILLSDLPG